MHFPHVSKITHSVQLNDKHKFYTVDTSAYFPLDILNKQNYSK